MLFYRSEIIREFIRLGYSEENEKRVGKSSVVFVTMMKQIYMRTISANDRAIITDITGYL